MSGLALDLVPDAFQDGWRAIVFGLLVMGGAVFMFEIGHWAGAIEEREYWAPLEEPPKRLWWRGWRWIEIHVIDRIKHRMRPEPRRKAPSALPGRHRTQDAAETQQAPTPEE